MGYSLSTFFRFFSRKKSKTATIPTNTAPAMKRNGELGALIEGCGIGGRVKPTDGWGVGWIFTSLVVGSIEELMAPAKNRTNTIARTGASKILMFSRFNQPLYVIFEGCSPLFNAIFCLRCSNFRTMCFMVGLKLLYRIDWELWNAWSAMNPKKCSEEPRLKSIDSC